METAASSLGMSRPEAVTPPRSTTVLTGATLTVSGWGAAAALTVGLWQPVSANARSEVAAAAFQDMEEERSEVIAPLRTGTRPSDEPWPSSTLLHRRTVIIPS